eukprot:m.32896 g.32896  ORF g.32896 m.32896 type:complete len:155 (-) comp16721_c1_seq1:92-556(-)
MSTTKFYDETYADGSNFKGYYNTTSGKKASGVLKGADGSIFTGSFDEAGKTSQGETKFANGSKFLGSYSENLPKCGTFTAKDGTIFKGTFDSGSPSKGAITLPDGSTGAPKLSGDFVGNKFDAGRDTSDVVHEADQTSNQAAEIAAAATTNATN